MGASRACHVPCPAAPASPLPAHLLQDSAGREAGLHCIRTKDGAEADFALSEPGKLNGRPAGGSETDPRVEGWNTR